MRYRVGFFAFFTMLFSMLIFNAIDDGGAGGADDIGDFEIEDDKIEVVSVEKSAEPEKKEEQSIQNKEIEELKAFKEQMEAERATSEAVSALTKKYPTFDANKIAEHLGAIAKEQGEDKAEALNNPLGWENIYLTQFKKDEPKNPSFDRGRGETKEPFNFKKGFEKAHGGSRQAVQDLLENSK